MDFQSVIDDVQKGMQWAAQPQNLMTVATVMTGANAIATMVHGDQATGQQKVPIAMEIAKVAIGVSQVGAAVATGGAAPTWQALSIILPLMFTMFSQMSKVAAGPVQGPAPDQPAQPAQ